MNSIKENIVLFSILLFIFLLFKKFLFIPSLISVLLIWFLRTKDYSFIYLCIICFITCIPVYSKEIPQMNNGYARKVNQNYAILQNGNEKVIVYTDSILQIDGEYEIHGTPDLIETTYHFYGFNYSKWLNDQGVYYSLDKDDIEFAKEHFSFRRLLQEKIDKIEDTNVQNILYKSLLNINVSDDDWMNQNGFSYSGILLILDWVLKFFLDKKHRDKILILFGILLLIAYRFPLLVLENVLFHILSSYSSIERRTGIIMTVIMILYPSQITSASFLIPAIFHYSFLFQENKKHGIHFCIFLIQSIFFQSIDLIRSFLYPVIQRLNGALFICSIIYMILHISLFDPVVLLLNKLNQISERFVLNGSILGVGFIFYIICLLVIQNKQRFFLYANILLMIFQVTGLFHPCMELSIINVGQGDSILIRAPFNSDNILIDTGKPSAYNSLNTFLKSKSIHTLNTMIITHSDNDHSGNQENVEKDYIVKQVITTHQSDIKSSVFNLLDINTITSEEENESSIVNIINLNGKQVCLMGDATEETEKDIINNNPNLSCDILKLGHHGSKTSSSDKFLDTVKPKLALISSGSYSLYHHPSSEVIQKLLKRHVSYFDTKESGDITILCFHHFNVFITSRFEIGLL